MALELLKSASGERMYSQYVFTDISSGFMAAATERFGNEQGMEYKVLDITLDPLEQGFDAHSFDLIIASNVSFDYNSSSQRRSTQLTRLLH